MSAATPPPEWNDAVRRADSVERQRFVEGHVDLVRYVALRLATRLPLSVEVDDLIHDGVLGLIDAVEKYEPDRGVRFRTYAERRVRGAILDGLRTRDWQPRAVRRNRRQLEDVKARLGALHGRRASEEEIASAMGLGLKQLRRVIQEAHAGPIVPLDQLPPSLDAALADDAAGPDHALEYKQLLENLAEALTGLPDRERQVLELYYHEGLNFKEVGAILGVTESRVCQLHGKAARRLRAALVQRMSPEPVGAGRWGDQR